MSKSNKKSDFDDLRRTRGLKTVAEQLKPPKKVSLTNGIGLKHLSEIDVSESGAEALIQNYIYCDTLNVVIAPPASYKSFNMADWSVCIGAGINWQGNKVAKQRWVVVINGEGQVNYRKRVEGLLREYELEDKDVQLILSSGAADLFADPMQLVEELKALDVEIGLVVFDTLNRNSPGADENSTKDMSTVINNVDMIKNTFGCAVAIVHHSPIANSARGRGSSSLFGAADAQFLISADTANLRYTLSCNKMKDYEPPAPLYMRGKKVGLNIFDSEGNEISSLVFERTDGLPPVRLGSNQKTFMKAAKKLAQSSKVDSLNLKEVKRMTGLGSKRNSEVLKSLESKGLVKRSGNSLYLIGD